MVNHLSFLYFSSLYVAINCCHARTAFAAEEKEGNGKTSVKEWFTDEGATCQMIFPTNLIIFRFFLSLLPKCCPLLTPGRSLDGVQYLALFAFEAYQPGAFDLRRGRR